MKTFTWYIYQILINDKVVYIGKTTNILNRIGQHLSCFKKPNFYFQIFINQHINKGIYPKFEIVFITKNGADAHCKEFQLIKESTTSLNGRFKKMYSNKDDDFFKFYIIKKSLQYKEFCKKSKKDIEIQLSSLLEKL